MGVIMAIMGMLALVLAACTSPGSEELNLDRADLRARAQQAETAGNPVQAVQLYYILYRADPENLETVEALARTLRRSGQATEGLRLLEGLPETEMPRPATLLLEHGKVAIAAGRADLALSRLTQARAAGLDTWQVAATLGIAYDRLERFAEAEREYRAALAVAPDTISVLNNYALSRALAGSLEEGLQILRRAVALPGAPPMVTFNLALLEDLKRQNADPRTVAEQLRATEPSDR